MSRSYKKNPGYSDNDRGKKWAKRQANKRVRRTLELDNGKAYRKVYNPWDICDHNFRLYSHKEAQEFADKTLWYTYKQRPYKLWIK